MSLGTSGARGRAFDRQFDRLLDAFYPVYERLVDENSSFVVELEEKLAEARMNDAVDIYLTRTLAWGAVVGAVLWLFGIAAGAVVFGSGLIEVGVIIGVPIPQGPLQQFVDAAKVPFVVFLAGLAAGAVGFTSVFGLSVAIPYVRANAREREINRLMPDAVSYMYALSVGGMSQLEILEAMADAEDTYGEVAKEFRTIRQETEYFDTDYRTAIQKRAAETPSDELGQFFTDMLSIINSGGSMTDFLNDKKDQQFRTAKEQQQRTLETLELFGEMYITLSLFPLLLVIILVIMQMMGEGQTMMLYGTIYGLIPLTGIGFLVLVSTVKQDELGDGYLDSEDSAGWFEDRTGGPLNLGLVQQFTGTYYVFDRIESREGTYETIQLLKQPHEFFRDNPLYTLALTVPTAVVYVTMMVVTGTVPVTWAGIVARPLWSTVTYAYVPLFVTCIPLAVFWEWNVRSRRAVLTTLSENLRKLASANATGLTLIESIRMVAETSSGKLADEFGTVYTKCNYGMSLGDSLVVFNNKYHIPRLARTVKLISKAHETSNEISTVLSTAARATEAQDDIERERKSRARMQVAVILMTYLTLLGVIAVLQTQFIGEMGKLTAQASNAGAGGGFGTAINADLLSLLFFHAVTLQAVLSGLICGYIREASVLSGAKYVVSLLSIALVVWVVVV